MPDLTPADRQRIKDVAILFHAQTITPADRLMGEDEKMPWDFPAYKPPLSWREQYVNPRPKQI